MKDYISKHGAVTPFFSFLVEDDRTKGLMERMGERLGPGLTQCVAGCEGRKGELRGAD